jgi:hypothetical protein
MAAGLSQPHDDVAVARRHRRQPFDVSRIEPNEIVAVGSAVLLQHRQHWTFSSRNLRAATLALADGDGALTGAARGAVAGAVVGGPVGAAVGGVAGAAIGGTASAPGPVVVAPGPAPCNTRTTTTQNNNTGASVTRQTTDCAN